MAFPLITHKIRVRGKAQPDKEFVEPKNQSCRIHICPGDGMIFDHNINNIWYLNIC